MFISCNLIYSISDVARKPLIVPAETAVLSHQVRNLLASQSRQQGTRCQVELPPFIYRRSMFIIMIHEAFGEIQTFIGPIDN